MKRFLILAFVALVAAGAWAAPITYTGQLTYGFTGNSDVINNSYSNAYLWLTGTLSEDTLAKVKLTANFRAADQHASLSEYFVSQNIGKLIGFTDPKALSLWVDMGVKDMTATTFPISDFSMENVAAYDPGAMDVVAARMTFGGLNVNAWVDPMGLTGGIMPTVSADATHHSRGTINAWTAIGPANVSVWYASNGNDADKGKGGGSVGVTVPVGDFSIGGDVEAVTDLSVATTNVSWGSAVQVGYKGYYVGAELIGNQDNLTESALEFQGTILPWFGFNTGVNLNMEPNAPQLFDSAELGGWFKWADGLKFRFGYLVTDNGGRGYSMYVPNPPTNGGFFLKANVSF